VTCAKWYNISWGEAGRLFFPDTPTQASGDSHLSLTCLEPLARGYLRCRSMDPVVHPAVFRTVNPVPLGVLGGGGLGRPASNLADGRFSKLSYPADEGTYGACHEGHSQSPLSAGWIFNFLRVTASLLPNSISDLRREDGKEAYTELDDWSKRS
jgi:hypothetical protein